MTEHPFIKRSTDVVFQNLAGEDGAVLLHLTSGQYHTLNPVATRIWEILETPMAEDALKRRIEQEFEADPATVAEDVRVFLDSLLERELVYRDSNQ